MVFLKIKKQKVSEKNFYPIGKYLPTSGHFAIQKKRREPVNHNRGHSFAENMDIYKFTYIELTV